MDNPLTVWYCDVCGKPIRDQKDGYVVWQSAGDTGSPSFKIIHQTGCDHGDTNSSAALGDFLGVDGLNHLLSFLSTNPVTTATDRTLHTNIRNFGLFVDFFRRVQLPYYEEARLAFEHPDYLEQAKEQGETFTQQHLTAVIRQFGRST